MATYKRKVITTRRAQPEALAALSLTSTDVKALSERVGDSKWYAAQRREAFRVYDDIPMPTLQDEPWRRTDIRALDWGAVTSTEARSPNGKVPEWLLQPLVGEQHGGQVVSNGGVVAAPAIDAALRDQGVILTDFLTATREHADLLQKYLGRAVAVSEGKFAALAATLATEGVFVYVPQGVRAELPLHAVLWASRRSQFSRTIIVAEDDASLTYVHELASENGVGQALHAGTVEIYVGRNADVKFIELQSLGRHFWHFTHERARIEAKGKLDWVFSAIGTRLTKNFSELDLVGDEAWGRMSGFYFAQDDQHFDHDTQQNHLAVNTTSDLLFKGALRDRSRSVWQGMIYVAPGAQKTDGYQANRNLVLDKTARADSIPGLEILADDVRCTHGATVGQLEAEHVFYLMSRGISYEDAKKLIVDGFFDPIMQRIPFEGVRDRMKRAIIEKMG